MSFYSTWQIAPTRSRPHPLKQGKNNMDSRYSTDQSLGGIGSILAAIPWDQVGTAAIEVGTKALPAIIDGISNQAGAMAQSQGASASMVRAVEAAARKRAEEEIAAKVAKEKAIRQRNWMLAGGISLVGLVGAFIILKK